MSNEVAEAEAIDSDQKDTIKTTTALGTAELVPRPLGSIKSVRAWQD